MEEQKSRVFSAHVGDLLLFDVCSRSECIAVSLIGSKTFMTFATSWICQSVGAVCIEDAGFDQVLPVAVNFVTLIYLVDALMATFY